MNASTLPLLAGEFTAVSSISVAAGLLIAASCRAKIFIEGSGSVRNRISLFKPISPIQR